MSSEDEIRQDVDKAVHELEREFHRVGVDSHLVAQAISRFAQGTAADSELHEIPIGMDVFSALRLIRSLPDAAGTAAFLRAMGIPV